MFDPLRAPVYINVRDRVRDLRQLVAWLEQAGHQRIVLLDNDSEWPPLLDYLAQTSHEVIRLGVNLGSRSIWQAGLRLDDWFVFTDPDVVPTADCPEDAVAYLYELAMRYNRMKVGLGLVLDDVPPDMQSLDWERQLLAHPIESGVYDSLVDTTFALYRPPCTYHALPALRTGAPYQVRHMPWYSTELDAEDRFYLSRAVRGPLGSSWAETAEF